MIVREAAARAVYSGAKMAKASLLSGKHVFSGLNCFVPGQTHSLHTHEGQDKLYFVMEGRGRVTVGSATDDIEAGDLVLAESGIPHALHNPGPGNLVVMAVIAPPPGSKAS